jgi:hypothetical protein
MKKLSESRIFAIIVLLFTIIAVAVLAKTVFGDAKKIKEETMKLDTLARSSSLSIFDSIASRDSEFKQLVDTVIVYQEIVNEKIIQREVENDSLRILRDELTRANSDINILSSKIKEIKKAQTIEEDTLIRKNTYVIVEPSYGKVETEDFTIKKKFGLLSDSHEVNYQDIKIKVFYEKKYGLSTNLGYGGMYGLDDGRFHHGVYLGVGGYYKF